MEEIELAVWQVWVLRIVVVLIVCLIAAAISMALQWPVRKLLGATERRKVGGTVFVNLVRVLVWGFAIYFLLTFFGIDANGILGAVGIVGIAVSLGAQQTIANLIGGIIVSLSKMVGPGDWITIQGHKEAKIVDTNWRRTILVDEQGIQFAVPNSEMVSQILEKGHPHYFVIVPLALKTTTPDVEGLLVECEQVVLDRLIEKDIDYEQKRPKAYVTGSSIGTINAEIKIFINRCIDSRSARRVILPVLVELLQERDVLADLEGLRVEK